MKFEHLVDVNLIANSIHIDYYENEGVFYERLYLYPNGCFVLMDNNHVQGYVISHPWHLIPPELNSYLKSIPKSPKTYFIHDIAIVPDARGKKTIHQVMELIEKNIVGTGINNLSLVSIKNTSEIWIKFGFKIINDDIYKPYIGSYNDGAHFMMKSI